MPGENKNDNTIGALNPQCKSNPRPSDRPAIGFDVARYETYLAETDLSEDQKREFLQALWSIICSFVELGFEIRAEDEDGQNNGAGQNKKIHKTISMKED